MREAHLQAARGVVLQQIPTVLNGAFTRAVRWRWIGVNPVRQASRSSPTAGPRPEPADSDAGRADRRRGVAGSGLGHARLAWLNPDTVTRRFSRMCKRLGWDMHIHQLRHYSATELIAAGVDIRTVAGRLGHGGGGTTTLRVYSAWVAEADQRAAPSLAARMPELPVSASTRNGAPARPAATAVDASVDESPYRMIAADLRGANQVRCANPGAITYRRSRPWPSVTGFPMTRRTGPWRCWRGRRDRGVARAAGGRCHAARAREEVTGAPTGRIPSHDAPANVV